MYRLIGRVVTEASFHEHVLDAILSKLPATGESKKTDGQVKIIPPSIRYLEIKKRLAALGFNKFNKKIDEAQDQSIIPILRRNRFIHDTWYADSPKDTAHQFAKVSLERTPLEKTEIEWKPVDKPYVVALIKDLRKCSKRAMALLRRIENLPLDPID